MEAVMAAIKNYIANNPTAFTQLATEDCPMVAPRDIDIVLGTVDLSRYENNIVVSIIGDSSDDTYLSIGDLETEHQLTVTFLCRGYSPEVLAKQCCRYAEGFRRLIIADQTMESAVDASAVGERRYYPDCGAVEEQMSAAEISVSVSTIMTI